MTHVESGDPMYTEWQAWQLVIQELRALGIEPNDERCDKLIRVTQAWGELLVELRLGQTDFVRDEARTHAMLRVLNAGIPASGPAARDVTRSIAPR